MSALCAKDQALAAAEAAYMPKGMVTVPFNPQVINTGSKLVLIDAGYGPGIAPSVGLLPAGMAAAGIDPNAIDIVVLSHLHPDHINGIKTADGKVAFPNAEIMAPSQDWAFWMSDENMAKTQDNAMMKGYFGNTRKILSDIAGKVTKYDWGKEIAPGITALATPGHTPGHTSFAVASGSSTDLGALNSGHWGTSSCALPRRPRQALRTGSLRPASARPHRISSR
jgi:glyoxylase-like metal-dependent hydrolase (beta-lactamase superfamily II)